ncbi:uncharacterized protein AMSG_07161 [Thecamonas trahens ATCC 50062]|uniref:Palmitoyltransferase n=1 Tax=Thecamonas trahens ATCC 50062 TaxID=461836 RepID=A0A0L0DF59_THETB|nr:hypothetical protein AMSG_07161 [Thecamonas trahens ATCC 50062]KNC50919.1 hypothetical protein AMSG_07161 [Thecamonas trahens ATCC 50062]|eukprot:XP_013756619.1 hypothetical protein AMSG_07161 [Thecamonas trahens ATCC 50062]
MAGSQVVSVLQWVQCVADTLIRLIGPLFVLLALTLTSSVIYVWWVVLLPLHVPQVVSFWGLIHCMVAACLIVNILYNYISCIITPPGTPSKEQMADLAAEDGDDGSAFCKKCNCVKPRRAHHCHVCKRCVLKMDHHCPWIHNCVGFYNHRYFVLFLIYMWAGCLYVAFMSSAPFFESEAKPWPYPIGRGSVVFVFVLTLSICLALTFMMVWQLYLVITAQTTIEFYFNRFRKKEAAQHGEVWVNEYDLGTWRNLDQFFGYRGQWWRIFFPAFSPPPGDGIHYPTLVESSVNYLYV